MPSDKEITSWLKIQDDEDVGLPSLDKEQAPDFDESEIKDYLQSKTGIGIPSDAGDATELPSEFRIPGGFEPDMQQAMISEHGQPPQEEKPSDRSLWEASGDIPAEFNSKIVGLLGIPGDTWNWAAKTMNATESMGPGWGSEDARQLAADMGMAYEPGLTPDTVGTKIGGYAALGMTFLAPWLMAGKGAALAPAGEMVAPFKVLQGAKGVKVTGAAEGVAQRIASPFIANPARAMTGELVGSVGAGVGAYHGGKEFGPTGELIGGLGGGVLPQLSLMGGPRLWDYGKKQLFPHSVKGAKMKLGERIRSLAETPTASKTALEQSEKILPGAKIPVAKLAGDRHLIALHNKVLEDNPVLAHKLELEKTANNALARDELKTLATDIPIEETQAHLLGRVKHIDTLIDKGVDKALLKAKDSMENLLPTAERATVHSEVARQVKGMKADAKLVNQELWDKVSYKTTTTTNQLVSNYKNELTKRAAEGISDPKDIPKLVKNYVGFINKKGVFTPGKFSKKATVRGLKTFRTLLYNEISKADATPTKKRFLNILRDAAFEDMKLAKGNDVQLAIANTKKLHDTFDGGVMGVIFGREKSGGKAAPELALESITPGTAKGGPKAAVEIQRLLEASPQSYDHLENLLKLQISTSSVINSKGRINVASAKRYMTHNEDLMRMFPKLKENMNHAIGLEERSIGINKKAITRKAGLASSTAAKLSGKKPGQVLPEILTSPYPEIEMKKFLSQSNEKGRSGIRNDIVNYLINKSETPSKMDENLAPLISGSKVLNLWNDNLKVFSPAFKEGHIKRLDEIINTLIKNEGLDNLPNIGEAVPPTNKLLTFVVGLSGTRFGAWLGSHSSGASLKSASMGSKVATDAAKHFDTGTQKRLLVDAIEDPKLFDALMSNTTKPPQMKRAWKIIQGWMVSVGLDTLEIE